MSIRGRSRSRGGSGSAKRCMRPGPITKNGYLNFLREYRKACCGMSPQETIIRGAQQWNKLSEKEKEKYNRMSKPRRRRRRLSSAKRCMRPGPVTNNGYLNFLRDYRKQCCGMSPRETIRRGAQQWLKLSEEEREKYNRLARRRSRSGSRGRRRVC
ncbi:protamine-like protein 99C [Lucilia cuprina]|uniref:protamine-like protein 99C n=1 Tax=Lucilia cuprina TaxID=7375 RepID=UPI001F06C397|nr:protamine-like protein 99C [Lucilia cuprina]